MHFRTILYVVLLSVLTLGTSGQAQHFLNYAVRVPTVGYMGLDSSLGAINKASWDSTDAMMVGIGLTGYTDNNFWWVTDLTLGFGKESEPAANTPARAVISSSWSVGMRYNFWQQRVRPFAATYLEVLRLANTQAGWASLFSFGLRPALGVEWFFGGDVSMQAEVSYGAFLNVDLPFRQLVMAQLGLNIYF